MSVYEKTENGIIGFGKTLEEAEDELYINKCKMSIDYDEKHIFTKRQQELSVWEPSSYMLHIRDVGCLIYKDGKITNTKTNKSVEVTETGMSIYLYLAILCGNSLSYTDISIVLAESLIKFFKSINESFVSIRDMPYIKLQDTNTGFIPDVVYTYNGRLLIGITETEVGMKYIGSDYYLTSTCEDKESQVAIIAYLAYKLGVDFSNGGIVNG